MEDYLYILLGVAWVAYSIYNQGQKQKKKQAQKLAEEDENEEPQVENAFENFIEKKLNLEGMFNFQETEEETEEEPEEEPLDSPYSKIDIVEEKDKSEYFKPENEGVSAFVNKVKQSQSTEVSSEIIDTDEISVNDLTKQIDETEIDFDLKSAVIFSEILNARYI